MIQAPSFLRDAPNQAIEMDALSEVLRLVRLTGSVFLNAELTAPWAVESSPSKVLAEALIPDADHLIEYHLVVEGRCFIEVADESPLELAQGDLVMVPRGDSHRMSSDAKAIPTQRASKRDCRHPSHCARLRRRRR
jgi:hypothetical protein